MALSATNMDVHENPHVEIVFEGDDGNGLAVWDHGNREEGSPADVTILCFSDDGSAWEEIPVDYEQTAGLLEAIGSAATDIETVEVAEA